MTLPDPSGPVRGRAGCRRCRPTRPGRTAAGGVRRPAGRRHPGARAEGARWARGSSALGDYRHGRSDLALVAVLPAAPDGRMLGRLAALHRELIEQEPDAVGLHCGHLPTGAPADPAAAHFAFARSEPMRRPVTAVTRRELLHGGEVLAGERPGALLLPVSDAALHAFVRAGLRDYWHPITARPEPWLRDVRVDRGPVTAARATAALREGRLIAKREPIGRLPALGAPPVLTPEVRAQRAEQARPFTRALIERALDGTG